MVGKSSLLGRDFVSETSEPDQREDNRSENAMHEQRHVFHRSKRMVVQHGPRRLQLVRLQAGQVQNVRSKCFRDRVRSPQPDQVHADEDNIPHSDQGLQTQREGVTRRKHPAIEREQHDDIEVPVEINPRNRRDKELGTVFDFHDALTGRETQDSP